MHTLRKFGIGDRVKVLNDGAEALDYLRGEGSFGAIGRDEYPRLILLDIKLPRVNGIDVLRQLKSDEVLKKLPVVMLTSSSQDSDISRCYALGANGYVVKPVEYDDFSKSIERIGIYWLETNVSPYSY